MVYRETCPQYFFLTTDSLGRNDNVEGARCIGSPPQRDKASAGGARGARSMVQHDVSHHSACEQASSSLDVIRAPRPVSVCPPAPGSPAT